MNQTAGVSNTYRRCSKAGKVSYLGTGIELFFHLRKVWFTAIGTAQSGLAVFIVLSVMSSV